MSENNLTRRSLFPETRLFKASLVFIIFYLVLSIFSDLSNGLLVTYFGANVPRILLTFQNEYLLYSTIACAVIAGFLLLAATLSWFTKGRKLALGTSILLILSFVPEAMSMYTAQILQYGKTVGITLFYYTLAFNIMSLITGILALGILFFWLSNRGLKAFTMIGILLRIASAYLVTFASYDSIFLHSSAPISYPQLSLVLLTTGSFVLLVVALALFAKGQKLKRIETEKAES